MNIVKIQTLLIGSLIGCVSSTCSADVELSIQQAQPFSNGGCFYVVATAVNEAPDFEMRNYGLELSVSGMNLSNLSSGFPPTTTAWEFSGLTGAATLLSPPPTFVQTSDFNIRDSFVVAQIEYDTTTPTAVSFEFVDAASSSGDGTIFSTSNGDYSTSNSSPTRLVLPGAANASNVFAGHDPGMYTSGGCADFVAVPEPSSFLFLTFLFSGWSWKKRRQRIAQTLTW